MDLRIDRSKVSHRLVLAGVGLVIIMLLIVLVAGDATAAHPAG
jgi:hypothetical protein